MNKIDGLFYNKNMRLLNPNSGFPPPKKYKKKGKKTEKEVKEKKDRKKTKKKEEENM